MRDNSPTLLGTAARRWRRSSLRESALLLVVLLCSGSCFAYSVLTHEEIVDLLWADEIRPLLLKRFPGLTDDQIKRLVARGAVIGAVTDLGSRSNDTLITSKVKARFVEANRFQINHVKVVTERGVVYLLGLVRRDEGDAAADIARTTSGAQRVVKVFEYVAG